MKKGLKKAVVFGLCAGLALTPISSCAKKDEEVFDTTKTVITVNDETLEVGVVNFAIRYQQSYLESLYAMYGMEDPYNSDLYGNGTTLGDMVKEQMVSELEKALLAEQHMSEYGLEITEDEKAAMAAAAEQFMNDNDADTLAKIGISQANADRYMELITVQNKMEKAMGADVDTEVSDEEAAQRRIKYVVFTPVTEQEEPETEAAEEIEEEVIEAQTEAETAALTENEETKTKSAEETELSTEAVVEETEPETEDPETVAARERAYEQAMQMIDAVKGGISIDDAAESQEMTVFEITLGDDYYITELAEATKGVADNTLIEEPILSSGGSYYVVYVVNELDREATDAQKENIVSERKSAAVDALYGDWMEAADFSADAEAIATIKFDFALVRPQEAETEVAEEAMTEAE